MEIVVLLHLGLAYWLYRYFMSRDRGAKEPRSALQITLVFGVVVGFVAAILNSLLLPPSLLSYLTDGTAVPSATTLLVGALMIGLIEESVKFIPLAFWIYKKKFFNETTDGIVYFGLCGMWFGAIESIEYALAYGEGVGVIRLVTGPFMHAGFTALAGWGLARWKFQRQWTALIGLFLLAVVLHGIYDYFLFTESNILGAASFGLAALINITVFVLFKRAQKTDELAGLSAVGTNKFCRSCGAPNPESMLYCTNCGRKT